MRYSFRPADRTEIAAMGLRVGILLWRDFTHRPFTAWRHVWIAEHPSPTLSEWCNEDAGQNNDEAFK